MTTELDVKYYDPNDASLPSMTKHFASASIEQMGPEMQDQMAVLFDQNPDPIIVSDPQTLLMQVENATLLPDMQPQMGGSILSDCMDAGCKLADQAAGIKAEINPEPVIVVSAPELTPEPINHYNRDLTMPTPGMMG